MEVYGVARAGQRYSPLALACAPHAPCGGIVCTQSRPEFTKHFDNNQIYIHFLHFWPRSEGGDAGVGKGGHGRGSVDAWTP